MHRATHFPHRPSQACFIEAGVNKRGLSGRNLEGKVSPRHETTRGRQGESESKAAYKAMAAAALQNDKARKMVCKRPRESAEAGYFCLENGWDRKDTDTVMISERNDP